SELVLFLFRRPTPPRSTLFPYTTLFRSQDHVHAVRVQGVVEALDQTSGMARYSDEADLPRLLRARGELVPLGVLQPLQVVDGVRSEEHTSELQSRFDLVCRLLLEKKKQK